ncbi:YidB family protein [Uruburuella testudinis]|uniref:YidB family protein n=1 Tax=Uruburuella testudinis TaxID=1282863 RepID=A0ABY4DQY2_9NEIS|nr:YidB family protein [Uruburuella testudinis]UOO81022.1 YidB family protein [Uruburuella testudinis]
MALMDSLINAAASALGNQNGQGGQQNDAIAMVMELVRQNGGVGNLINQLQQGGLGGALESWISSNSANQSVSGNDLQSALGGGVIDQLAGKFGMSGQQAGDLLAQYLPNLVDSATPNGTAQDADGFGLDDLASLVLKNLVK